MKKLLKVFGIIIGICLIAMISIPLFFKGTILSKIKTAANESMNATLEFSDLSLSFFRQFPKLSVGLDQVEITGKGDFEGVKLLKAERLDLSVDVLSAIFGSTVVINGVHLEKPDLNVFVLKNGKANYDITKPTPAGTPESSGSDLQLQKFSIHEGNIHYEDRASDLVADVNKADITGRGDMSAALTDIDAVAQVGDLSVASGGMSYLKHAKADWDMTVSADMVNSKYTLKQNKLKINALEVNLDGWVQMPENSDDINMDLTFGTPSNDFKSLLSLIPGAYTQDFSGVNAAGTVQFSGFAKGKYNEKVYPAFQVNCAVANGDFKYPTLPLGVSNINVDMKVNCPTSDLNTMTVNIPKFGLKIGSNPIEGFFNLKTPVSDPNVDTKIKGVLNLAELSKAFPMEGVQSLTGIIDADIAVKAAQSYIDKKMYDLVSMDGKATVSQLDYRSKDMPAVKINKMATSFSPQSVVVSEFDANLGRSDLKASGNIDNILAWFSPEKTMKGTLTARSNYFDANEWMTPADPAAGATPTDKTATEKAFDRWDFLVDGQIGKLKYDAYDLTGLNLNGHFTPNNMDIANFAMKIGASDLSGSGKITNAWNYLFDNQTVSGNINLNSNYFDLNQFMTDEPATKADAPPAEVILVPENVDMSIAAKMQKVKYTNMDLDNLDGVLKVKDRSVTLQDCTAETLGGEVGLTGAYNTQSPAKPIFNMDMAIRNMSFRQAYSNFITIKTFAPIAQFMDGRFNTTLSLAGGLTKNMTPDLNSLTAAGFMETLDAVVNNFKPLNDLNTKLKSDIFKSFSLENTKNWFEIKDGYLTLKPFDFTAKGIAMSLSGGHGLTADMNYSLTSKIPRKMLESNAAGSALNNGLSVLSGEASKLGVNIAQGEFINVLFSIGGAMMSPKIGMKVLGTSGKNTVQEELKQNATEVVDKAKDSLRNVATREVDKAKARAEAVADSLKREAEKKMDEAKAKAQAEVKKKADEAAKKAEEALGKEGKKTVDEVKDKVDKYNPFKKKKN